jgi:UDP-N-acetylmuramyl pentapeptide synthase
MEEAAALLRDELKPGDAVLIKGSRANAMERIVEALLTTEHGQTDRTPSRT